MRSRTLLGLSLLLATVWPSTAFARSADPGTGLHGRVWAADSPADGTAVFAYEVASAAIEKVLADRHGQFLFSDLPAGLYKVVAHKSGFQPAVEVVLRRRADEVQEVELRLAEETAGAGFAEAFWEARRAVPADVLRELHGFAPSVPTHVAQVDADRLDLVTGSPQAMRTQLTAAGGVHKLGSELGELQRRSAGIGIEGAVGDLTLGLRGRFEELDARADAGASPLPSGAMHSVDLDVSSPEASALRVSSSTAETPALLPEGVGTAELSRHRIDWSGQTGERGHSAISARYVEEHNFHRQGILDPVDFPLASRTWDVAGQYRQTVSESTNIEAGVRFEQRSLLGSSFEEPIDTLDVFGRGDSRIRPRVLVEYGLFSTVREEGLSLMPHGGLVVELGRDWKATGTFARRVQREDERPAISFATARYDDPAFCREAGEACYEIRLSQGEDLETVSIGAVHREFAETLRLYFGDDFFDRLQSVFVVQGDRLPEVNFRLVRQISPRILATLQSNVASGGGGIFYATDSRSYENDVRYLVTSLDTRFQSTATGVFISFHHLEQNLLPTDGDAGAGSAIEMQRLQLMLTQDLSALANLANHFAVRLNMELSRGSTPYTLAVDDELHRKLSGGISVSF